MYSDNRWDFVTAGRTYPKPADSITEAVAREVRERLNVAHAFERNRRRRPAEPLVKPAAYKALNESNGSGPSGARS